MAVLQLPSLLADLMCSQQWVLQWLFGLAAILGHWRYICYGGDGHRESPRLIFDQSSRHVRDVLCLPRFGVFADPSDTVPPIRIAWLKKFEGDDFFHPTVVNQSQLEFNWDTAQVGPPLGMVGGIASNLY